MIVHLCGRWPEQAVPPGEAEWWFLEIDQDADAIVRDVQLFSNGHVGRNSLEIEAQHGVTVDSLTDQPAMSALRDASLEPMSAEDFELLWNQGFDTPFWSRLAQNRGN